MSELIPASHPYWSIREVAEREVLIEKLSFSYYVYRPQSLVDERKNFFLTREQFLDFDLVSDVMSETPEGFELAIHSLVTLIGGDKRHIPMIDMSTSAKAHLEKLRGFIGEAEFGEYVWFKSGRSFHGYGRYLQDDVEWVRQLGKLLLANQKNLAPTVDPRWVGHRLVAGYSALRWTRNTERYLGVPVLIS